jgi:CHAT domain-containing protein
VKVPGTAFSQRIENAFQEFDAQDLILRFDVDFDAPLRREYAIGVLRLLRAFRPTGTDLLDEAIRVGAHWCAIVQADVDYELLEGLRLIEASRLGVARLLTALEDGTAGEHTQFMAYVAARWHDGSGKIFYRVGTFARARQNFEAAVAIARTEAHRLDWCLSDLLSNELRGIYEELKQSTASDTDEALTRMIAGLEADIESAQARAERDLALLEQLPADAEAPVRERESLRGWSSLLHNLAFARKELRDFFTRTAKKAAIEGADAEAAQRWEAADLQHELSTEASKRSLAVSRTINDEYRISQSYNHQAVLARENQVALFEQVRHREWRRGQVIARQRLAEVRGGWAGVEMIRELIAEEARQAESGDGLDVSMYAYSVDTLEQIVNAMPEEEVRRSKLRKEVIDDRIKLAESVRGAVSLPAYKRQYAASVRPGYRQAVGRILDLPASTAKEHEEAFRLTEESTGRELLDMLAAAVLPQVRVAKPAKPARQHIGGDGRRQPATDETRGMRRNAAEVQQHEKQLIEEMTRRQTEFEEQFLRQPLEATPPDPEIAYLVQRHIVNNRGTCLVRYLTYEVIRHNRRVRLLGAHVFRGSAMRFHPLGEYDRVPALLRVWEPGTAPNAEHAAAIWDLLIGPLWDKIRPESLELNEETLLSHLVLVPTDDIFLVPVHLACPAGTGMPLAARVPLSSAVSAMAFVARGRHLLKRQPVDDDDDLAAIIVHDPQKPVSGDEIVGTDWDEKNHLYVMGTPPPGLQDVKKVPADFAGLAAISDVQPEFLVYAGHGNVIAQVPELGPYLQLPTAGGSGPGGTARAEIITQFDIALRLRLPRNKLTVLGACLAGRSAQTEGGDVGGFLRALMAAGAGAISVPLWSVRDAAMVETVNHLLIASRVAVKTTVKTFDVVQTLHEHYRTIAEERTEDIPLQVLFERMPIGIYL